MAFHFRSVASIRERLLGIPICHTRRTSKFEAVSTASPLYFEELELGRRYGCGSVTLTREEMIGFARVYDPQPFHLDEEAAEHSVFKGLVASGWQTAALTMKLRVEGDLQIAGGWIGLGIDKIVWPTPVRPGDQLTASTEVVEMRESKSKPKWGVIKVKTTTINQKGETVCEVVSNQLILRRS
jgi:acyl dehydratase